MTMTTFYFMLEGTNAFRSYPSRDKEPSCGVHTLYMDFLVRSKGQCIEESKEVLESWAVCRGWSDATRLRLV